MTPFEQFLDLNKLDPVTVLNALQLETCLVSDNCVTAADVSSKDASRAIQWVRREFIRGKAKL